MYLQFDKIKKGKEMTLEKPPPELDKTITTEDLQTILREIEPLVTRGIMRASFTAPEGKIFRIKRSSGKPIGYHEITTSHGHMPHQINEFLAGIFGVFNGYYDTPGEYEPVVEARSTLSESSDHMDRVSLQELEISVEELGER